MKTWMVRVAVYSSVTLLAAAVVAYRPQLPNQSAIEVIERHAPAWRSRVDTLGRGEPLTALLARVGVPLESAEALLRSAPSLDDRRIPAGMEVATRQAVADSLPAEVVLRLSEDRNLRLIRTDSGWSSVEERIPWTRDTVAYQGTVESNLYDAVDHAAPALSPGARAGLAWGIADILEYRYDMSRDLRGGDVFKVLVERETSPNGGSRIGDVLVLAFTTGQHTTEAVRHPAPNGRSRYFDQNGKSLEAAFLRAPLQFRRISSRFGMRKHPILGVWRRHAGTDYAAGEGTPIRSIGDGVVAFAGRKGGYGNAIDVRHANGYVSRYGHLRSFAKGISRGDRVGIGQTIGYVGHTGLATAPHLHFEILVAGRQRDPRLALQRVEGKPLDVRDKADYLRSRTLLLALMERGLGRDTLVAVGQ
ncbi:MAG TPA: peptidoglycan DD-metalloendopeptidase family protein [Gemmatimonadaceae bacterium]|nr:peptidoglycan DD-metalloendopeptidase family protein [Gemmatimonadaceae bacterium]